MFQRLPRGGHTRSLSEHGSQAPHRRWYLAHGPGRVGRRWILEAPRLTAGGLFVFTDRPALMQAGNCGRASLSPSRPVSTGRSWLLFYIPPRFVSLPPGGGQGSPPRQVDACRLRLTPPPKQQLEGPFFLHTVPSRGCRVRDSHPEGRDAGSASAARNLTQEKGRRPSHCEGLHGVGFWRYS